MCCLQPNLRNFKLYMPIPNNKVTQQVMFETLLLQLCVYFSHCLLGPPVKYLFFCTKNVKKSCTTITSLITLEPSV